MLRVVMESDSPFRQSLPITIHYAYSSLQQEREHQEKMAKLDVELVEMEEKIAALEAQRLGCCQPKSPAKPKAKRLKLVTKPK
jgi:hypothetical protein